MKAFELKEAVGFDGLISNPNRAIRDPAAGQVKPCAWADPSR